MIFQAERLKWKIWMFGGLAVMLLVAAVGLSLMWPIAQLWEPLRYDSIRHGWRLPGPDTVTGVTAAWWSQTWSYFTSLLDPRYFSWWTHQIWWRFYDRPLLAGQQPVSLVVSTGTGILVAALFWALNPFDPRPTALGGARWAIWRDVIEDNLNGPTGFVLGRAPLFGDIARKSGGIWDWFDFWKTKWFGQTLVRWGETISGVMLAPPGTGKTVQLIGMILADWPDRVRTWWGGWKLTPFPGPSFLINDPKGEIFRATAAWRATLGPVFKLSWGDMTGHQWNPIGWGSLPGGRRMVELRRQLLEDLGAMYAGGESKVRAKILAGDVLRSIMDMIQEFGDGWADRLVGDPLMVLPSRNDDNPEAIDRMVEHVRTHATPERVRALHDPILELATLQSRLEKLVDQQMAIIVPESVEQHWKATGRACGAGMTLFVIERSIADPDVFGEPSYAKVLSWLAGMSKNGKGFRDRKIYSTGEKVIDSSNDNTEIDVTAETIDTPEGSDGDGGDADADLTAKLLDEAIREGEEMGFSARTLKELKEVRMKPDKERGSVVSTFAAGISIFKNAAVAARTSTCSFGLADFRGMEYKGKKNCPISVYVTISLEDARFLGSVTGLLVESLANFLLSQDDEMVRKQRQKPVFFMLDEFWTLPAVDSIRQIPSLGRGLWAVVLVVGQSWKQIASKFKADGANVVTELKTSAPVRIIPTQTDDETAESVSKSIGNQTVVQTQVSRTMGMGKGVEPFQRNESESWTSLPLARPEQVASMEMFNPRIKHWGVQLVQLAGSPSRPLLLRPAVWFLDPVFSERGRMREKIKDISTILYRRPANDVGSPPMVGSRPTLGQAETAGKKAAAGSKKASKFQFPSR